jgi:hypothetical protein
MRLLFTLVLLVTSAVATRAADVEFLRVWPGWRDVDSFDRISEYFKAGEHIGRQVILRTHAEARAGYYFLVRVKSAVAINAAKFEVSVIRPDNPESKTYSFSTSVPQKETVFELGLTGTDWPAGQKANPVAWKLRLLSSDGQVLAEQKSFLWEKPGK